MKEIQGEESHEKESQGEKSQVGEGRGEKREERRENVINGFMPGPWKVFIIGQVFRLHKVHNPQ